MLRKCTHGLGPSGFDVCDSGCCAWEREVDVAPSLDAVLSIDLPRMALSALPCRAGSFLPELGSDHLPSGLRTQPGCWRYREF